MSVWLQVFFGLIAMWFLAEVAKALPSKWQTVVGKILYYGFMLIGFALVATISTFLFALQPRP